MWRNYSISSLKTLDEATQSWTNTKLPANESKFYKQWHIFLKQEKNCIVPDFPIYLASCRVKTRPKITQDSEDFALKLEDALLAAIFFALIENFIVQLYCGQSLVEKAAFKPRKEIGRGFV